ncbi:MAG: AMP-binding protein, partial [Beijerinckiaceae bacterium]|nr:AMP-binding protein [Beijerinckiaceae bacterium]
PYTLPLPAPTDIACIMYTSGTTGAPKGVLMPHAHCYLFGLGIIDNLGLGPDDHYYICLPLYHANGLLMQFGAALIAGAPATIRERFSASAWLSDIQRCGATITNSLGAISAFVLAQPATAGDRNHKLRMLLSAPNHVDHETVWRERFGIAEVIGGYGMTEVNIPLYGERGVARPGACGRPYARYFEVEIRNATNDMPVSPGEVGEIMVRPRMPGGFMAGYFGLPDKTVEAWRNFWFHTGDAGRMDADGYVVFVDRIKDCIRRRGENISATDIEASFIDLAGVKEIAAYAVPSDIEGGEDEIMLAIVPDEDVEIAPQDVLAHARRKVPRYAQPRYLKFHDSLPKTGSEKVRKVELRQAGIASGTVDLEKL